MYSHQIKERAPFLSMLFFCIFFVPKNLFDVRQNGGKSFSSSLLLWKDFAKRIAKVFPLQKYVFEFGTLFNGKSTYVQKKYKKGLRWKIDFEFVLGERRQCVRSIHWGRVFYSISKKWIRRMLFFPLKRIKQRFSAFFSMRKLIGKWRVEGTKYTVHAPFSPAHTHNRKWPLFMACVYTRVQYYVHALPSLPKTVVCRRKRKKSLAKKKYKSHARGHFP